MKQSQLPFWVLFLGFVNLFSGTGRIQGVVVDSTNKEPIPYAFVKLIGWERQAYTDFDGFFIMDKVVSGEESLLIRSIGYSEKTIYIYVPEDSTLFLTITMVPQAFKTRTEQKTPAREIFEQEITLSQYNLLRDELQGYSSGWIDDPIRSSERLPGLTILSDIFGQFYIRGTSLEQIGVIYDGIPVYNPYHLAGLLSAFNTNGLRSLRINSGALSPSAPDRTGGIIELTPRNIHEPFGSFNIQPFWWSADLGIPIVKELGLYCGYRGALISKLININFNDYTLRASIDPNTKNSISIIYYHSLDSFSESDTAKEPAISWGNNAFGIRSRHILGSKIILRLSYSYSRFKLNLVDIFGQNKNGFFDIFTDQGGGIDLTIFQSESHRIKLGLGFTDLYFNYHALDNGETSFVERHQVYIPNLYCEVRTRVNERFMIEYGARTSYFSLGDRLTFQPRIKARYFLNKNLAAKAYAGIANQYIRTLNSEEYALPMNLYFPGKDVPPLTSYDITAGIEQWLGDRYTLSAEAFYKNEQNLTDFNEESWGKGDYFITGNGSSAGVEFFAKKSGGRLNGYISYTLLDARREFNSLSYPPGFLRRHTLKLASRVWVAKWFGLCGIWYLASGTPYTPPGSSAKNSATLPYYSRFDLDLRFGFNITRLRLELYMQILNLFNKGNFSSKPLRYDEPMKGLPLFPIFGIHGEF